MQLKSSHKTRNREESPLPSNSSIKEAKEKEKKREEKREKKTPKVPITKSREKGSKKSN